MAGRSPLEALRGGGKREWVALLNIFMAEKLITNQFCSKRS
jgi:hypothetical protein